MSESPFEAAYEKAKQERSKHRIGTFYVWEFREGFEAGWEAALKAAAQAANPDSYLLENGELKRDE